MKHTCDDCGEYKELTPLEDNINKQTYYICNDCNEKRSDAYYENGENY